MASRLHRFHFKQQEQQGRVRSYGHVNDAPVLVILWGGLRPPEKDTDEPLALVRITSVVVQVLTRPTIAASLPSGVVLALITLVLVAPLSQTILTFILFLALATLGRLAGTNSIEDDDDDDDEKDDTSWTDVFSLVFAASTAYLVLPTSLVSLESGLLARPAIGLGLLGTTVAVLWQTNAAATSADEKDDLDGSVNGVNGELLYKWDKEMKIRELQIGKKTRDKEDD